MHHKLFAVHVMMLQLLNHHLQDQTKHQLHSQTQVQTHQRVCFCLKKVAEFQKYHTTVLSEEFQRKKVNKRQFLVHWFLE